jgi:hypothetical protein
MRSARSVGNVSASSLTGSTPSPHAEIFVRRALLNLGEGALHPAFAGPQTDFAQFDIASERSEPDHVRGEGPKSSPALPCRMKISPPEPPRPPE